MPRSFDAVIGAGFRARWILRRGAAGKAQWSGEELGEPGDYFTFLASAASETRAVLNYVRALNHGFRRLSDPRLVAWDLASEGEHGPDSASLLATPSEAFARAVSGIAARDMLRTTTLGELDEAALAALTPTIGKLAGYEGLPCHATAAGARTRLGDCPGSIGG